MTRVLWLVLAIALSVPGLSAQNPREKSVEPVPESADMQELKADVDHLKVLLNQMRTNLAFVQTSQSPLKHQFELEADAWQVIIEQMDRRLKAMEDRKSR